MKETMTWTQCLEKKGGLLLPTTVLPTTALIWALSLLSPTEWLAQEVSRADEGEKITEVTTPRTVIEDEKTISLEDAMQELQDSTWVKPSVEQPTKAPTKFTISTWVGYTIWGDVKWVNRIQWSWELLQGTPLSTRVTWAVDLDDPMHSKWSWKVIIWKSIYKWISLDWDYTFTWTWWNLLRFGIGYTWQLWKWVYGIKIFPLNTNESPISAKAMVSTKVWKNWELSSFVLVDYGKKSYYGETEYDQKIAEWIALFIQARLWWKLDGRFWEWDTQNILWWVRFDIR